jgi:hypothetical protein
MPPWINKFYILDLRPKNSFIRWAVEQGHTVFVVSWVNPDEKLAEKGFEDYMMEGPYAALDAMEKAILSQDRPIILIAGGKDKGVEFDDNADLVREKVRAAVLIGEMKDRIASSWKDTDCHTTGSLEEAVNKAQSRAQAGDVVLFSPGTSSYDMFRNYGERGNIFKTLVQNLKNNPSNTP